MPDKNVIQKQSLHFQYNGKADGFALQKEVSDWCKLTLFPELAEQLEPFAMADDYITIDKLVIDATVDKTNWQQKIRSELMLSLSKKLNGYKPVLKETTAIKETVARKLDELILFYFEKGFLPWWGKAFVQTDFKTILQQWVKESMPASRAVAIVSRLQQIISQPVINRIVNHFPKQYYFQFLQNIFKAESAFINEVAIFLKELLQESVAASKKTAIEKSVHSFMLTMLIKNEGKADKDLLLQFIFESLNKHKIAVSVLIPQSKPLSHEKGLLKTIWYDLLINENKMAIKKPGNSTQIEKKLKYNKTIDKLKAKPVGEKSKEELQAFIQEGIYIENAGALIIAAFIPALFAKLKISNNQIIVNSNLAAMLIHYAVTGNTKMEEYELVLPKILCGIDLELPVNTNSRITAGQKKEVDEMLSAVIEYWAVIKNTSISGLRESFLKRSGKLSLIDDDWLLQVEQKPFDMLLQQLPWSVSMIRLPWMKNLLKTEWI